jgi:hypothetical protein
MEQLIRPAMESTHLIKLFLFNYDSLKYSEEKQAEEYSDVTLVCDDGDISVPLQVIASRSSVFNKILKKTKTMKKMHIKGILTAEMRLLLDLIENGETLIPSENSKNIIKKGKMLGIMGITPECDEKLEDIPSGQCRHQEPDIGELVIQTTKKSGSSQINFEIIPSINDHEIIKQEKSANDTWKASNTHFVKREMLLEEESLSKKNVKKEYKPEEYSNLIDTVYTHFPATHDSEPSLKTLTVLDVVMRNSMSKQSFGQLSISCNLCREIFEDMRRIRKHMEVHFEGLPNRHKPAMAYQREGTWRCLDCGKSGPKHHLREHIEVHIPGLQYQCPECGIPTFKTKNALRSHMKRACKTRKEFKSRS